MFSNPGESRDERSRGMDKALYTEPWYVYIAECRDKTLYVGVAKDVNKRIEEHNTTGKCRYTRFRKPLLLKYAEFCENYNIARKREIEIKRFSRKKKTDLITTFVLEDLRPLIPPEKN
jgi:putative endonuclease